MTSTLAKATTEDLISLELRGRLTSQLIKEHAGMTGDEAVRIVDQAVAYLKTCTDNPGVHLRPSQRVDLGWHQFILNTVDYAEFCERVAGYFIHHVPDEFTLPRGGSAETVKALAPTVEAMRASGFKVDAELWMTKAGDCTQCHSGCTNCGQGDGKPNC
ncbi:hypothetical protein [Umezawaea sp. Da 62-37]|uniref:glycine-rich domain-containing protein n=1 Tax=Umezawaea sp. Da 62-37 TaxID=3075927 RepID=UPI0028F6DF8C|nr:hypothetical protein [Umezawaea sp. Da 62-37]WNV90345.1 hypothetical protein RM788_19305 [Umezawaea sp. Da 62-37]